MSSEASANKLVLTDTDVILYLQQNPNFFVDKLSLLADLELPHQTGDAVSLIERQVSVLRDRNMDMRHRLSGLIDNARRNDKLFEKTKRLILHLLEAQDINDFIDALMHSFDNDFEIEHTSLVLFSEIFVDVELSTKSHTRLVSLTEASQVLGTIISNNQTICGQLGDNEQTFVFQDRSAVVGSTAITPLTSGRPLGALAIGNGDLNYYRSSMSTLFLSYIGEVISRLLPRFID